MGDTKSRSAFEMFELDEAICDILGLSTKSLMMLYFDGTRPVISWEENDRRTIQGKTAVELQANASELERHRGRFDLVRML
jgi:hypothetical protein